jgi:hypothetical protein
LVVMAVQLANTVIIAVIAGEDAVY